MENEDKGALFHSGADVAPRFSMTMSVEVGEIAAAIAKAQARMAPAFKEARNPHHGNYYATLASCTEAIKPLHDEGIAVVQPPIAATQPGFVAAQTLLLHKSGQWLRGILEMPVVAQTKKDGNKMPIDNQTYGSALTYARRYCLTATCGLATSDDDGEAAAQVGRVAPGPGVTVGEARANGQTKTGNKPGPKKAEPRPDPAPEEPQPSPEDLGPPPDETAEEPPQRSKDAAPLAAVVQQIGRANTPDALQAYLEHSKAHHPPNEQKEVWEAIATRCLALIPKSEPEDMRAWHALNGMLNKPQSVSRAYAERYKQLASQRVQQ